MKQAARAHLSGKTGGFDRRSGKTVKLVPISVSFFLVPIGDVGADFMSDYVAYL